MPVLKDVEFNQLLQIQAPQGGSDYPLRVLLYSHDSVGLGHLRRNLAIAGEIATVFPHANILIVTGSPRATQFQLPANTDLIKIPCISKDSAGHYMSGKFSGSLEKTLAFRSNMILAAFNSFEPGLIIMDHQVIGLKGEALPMLREAKAKGVLCIYGLRDIKDSPEVVKPNWQARDCQWALNEAYDRVCIYGQTEVFDPRVAYAPMLDHAKQVNFTGYIVPKLKKVHKPHVSGDRKRVLVLFGGGGDGVQRAKAYLKALASAPVHWDSHIITGPLMDADSKRQIRKMAKRVQPIGSIKVRRFHADIPALLARADAVVSMAGYNSCAEILQSGVPAVLMPRSFPRKEQQIRASSMSELGWVNTMEKADYTPEGLFAMVDEALARPRQQSTSVNLDGLGKLSQIIVELLISAGLLKNMPQSDESQSSAM